MESELELELDLESEAEEEREVGDLPHDCWEGGESITLRLRFQFNSADDSVTLM